MTVLAIAHRAGNSLKALQQAMEAGADVIEADVHAHRGRLEIRHLKTMGPLPFLWDAWKIVPAWAPRLVLDEVLAAAGDETTFMLDVKGKRSDAGEAVARILHEQTPGRTVIVCSRYWPALDSFWDVSWARVVLSARTRPEMARLMARLRSDEPAPYGVSVHRSLLTRPVVTELHERVEVVMTWPVNDAGALAQVMDVGVTGVISDEIDIVRDVMRAREKGDSA